jgi:serine phosphatase RsbU (regulator of sigma subunit)
MPARILNYLSVDTAPPEDPVFDRARALQLARRLRWYCIAAAVYALIRILLNLDELPARLLPTGAAVVEVALIAVAFFLARASGHAGTRRLARLSMGLVAISGLLYLAVGRIDGDIGTGFLSVFLRHLLACCFLPWNSREAIVAAVVLVAGNVVFGLLHLATGGIGATTLAFTVALAPTAVLPGIVLSWYRNSRFRKQVKLENESDLFRSLFRELDSARRIHEACLPSPIRSPRLDLHYVYQPFRSLGGDLLFVHPQRHGHASQPILLVLLDVAGHGIVAALAVNRIVGEIERLIAESVRRESSGRAGERSGRAGESSGHHSESSGHHSESSGHHSEVHRHVRELSPADFARHLNRYVRLTLARHNLFATALICRVDPLRNRLTWVNCGHPPPLLILPDGSSRPLDGDTLMLGVTDEVELNAVDQTELFDPGSVLLACTDGATEARTPDGAALCQAGFRDMVANVTGAGHAVEHYPAELAKLLASYRAAPPDDDTLLLAVHCKAAPDPVPTREALAHGAPHA